MSEDLNPRITNHHWLSMKIQAATSVSDLRQVHIDILCDQFEGEPWTEDRRLVDELRREIRWKLRILSRRASDQQSK